MPAVRQKLHLSPCADFRSRLFHRVTVAVAEGDFVAEAGCVDRVTVAVAEGDFVADAAEGVHRVTVAVSPKGSVNSRRGSMSRRRLTLRLRNGETSAIRPSQALPGSLFHLSSAVAPLALRGLQSRVSDSAMIDKGAGWQP